MVCGNLTQSGRRMLLTQSRAGEPIGMVAARDDPPRVSDQPENGPSEHQNALRVSVENPGISRARYRRHRGSRRTSCACSS
jgi:hypothetical protein